MTKIIVDLDDTLFKSGKISYYLRTLAKILFKLSLYLQRPNKKLIEEMKKYDEVIILTARGNNYLILTDRQLNIHGVKYNRIYACDYQDLTMKWKWKILSEEKPNKWVDDMKDYAPVGLEGY